VIIVFLRDTWSASCNHILFIWLGLIGDHAGCCIRVS